MSITQPCPECHSAWLPGQTCRDTFYQMAAWELEYPEGYTVHHLMVLCYHLQHPSLYSPKALELGVSMLADFIERGVSPAEMRRQIRPLVESSGKQGRLKGTPGASAAYPVSIQWTMTAADVVGAGPEEYIRSITAWARSILTDMQEAGL